MLSKPRSTFAITLVAAAALSACSGLLPDSHYTRPDLKLPPATTAVASANNVNPATWWKGFADPVLDALLDEANRNNQDLALATARIAEVRASLSQTHSNLFPTVDLNGSATRRRSSENSATVNPNAPAVTEDRQLGLSASYEIDFWGRYSRADDAARARLLAQSASRASVLTTLQANVAQSYFALRALDAQAVLAERTLSTRTDSLKLQKRRFEGGVIGELDLRQAESEAASALATAQQVRLNRANAETALAMLLGRQPADMMRPVLARGAELGALYMAQVVPAGLQSDLLAARPDIVAAEQNLIAAQADIGQARALYFPRISITANVGQQSKDMSTLMDPASVFWNVLGNLTQPVFRAGAIGALVSAATARQQQALAQYTLAVQNAFRDTHDAITSVEAGRELATTAATRLGALRETMRLADLRYKAGYTGYLEVLNAQRDLAQAETALVDAQRNQLNAVVSLYRALGGGWSGVDFEQIGH